MDSSCVLHWELYGPGSVVEFCAQRHAEGYALHVNRDDQVIVQDTAADPTALLRKSRLLRAAFQDLGFASKPAAQRASQLGGGVCWGPASQISTTVVAALQPGA